MAHSTFGKTWQSNIIIRAKQYAMKVNNAQTSRGNREQRRKRWAGVVKEVFADGE